MTDLFEDDQMPSEIDFSDGTRGLHLHPPNRFHLYTCVDRA